MQRLSFVAAAAYGVLAPSACLEPGGLLSRVNLSSGGLLARLTNSDGLLARLTNKSYVAYPASSYMLVSNIKPCMSQLHCTTVKPRMAHLISRESLDDTILF